MLQDVRFIILIYSHLKTLAQLLSRRFGTKKTMLCFQKIKTL
jgi:hypothetical protein